MAWKNWRAAPLPGSFMLTAILGFLVSAIWVTKQNYNWGVAFMIVFSLMFIASIISFTRAPIEEEWAMERRRR